MEQLTLSAELADGGMELLTVEADVASGRCTGARAAARQELRAAVMGALAEGVIGTRRIAQVFGVSRETVRALRALGLKTGELDQHKQRLGRSFIALAEAAADRMLEEIDEMPKASLPIIAGVATDKGQLLTGGATSRIERHEHVSADRLNELIDALPVVAEPVDEGTNLRQKGSGAEALESPNGAAGEPESLAFPTGHEGAGPTRAADGADSAERRPAQEERSA